MNCETAQSLLFRERVPLASFSTLRIGGTAHVLATPNSVDDFISVRRFANQRGLPIYVIGKGSNLLIDDGLIKAVVCRFGADFSYARITGDVVTAGAAMPMPKLAKICMHHGASGYEWMAGVPGTVGAAVAINAGTHDGCIRDQLLTATVMARNGSISCKPVSDLQLRYRGSRILDTGACVLEATFRLTTSACPAAIRETMRAYMAERQRKFPLGLANCGSVFKRPDAGEGPYCGQLIEAAGLKALQRGDAEISERHANFIVNRGHASADDVRWLVDTMRDRVFQATGVLLERELRYLPHDHKPAFA